MSIALLRTAKIVDVGPKMYITLARPRHVSLHVHLTVERAVVDVAPNCRVSGDGTPEIKH